VVNSEKIVVLSLMRLRIDAPTARIRCCYVKDNVNKPHNIFCALDDGKLRFFDLTFCQFTENDNHKVVEWYLETGGTPGTPGTPSLTFNEVISQSETRAFHLFKLEYADDVENMVQNSSDEEKK
jgi:hypothetical protein